MSERLTERQIESLPKEWRGLAEAAEEATEGPWAYYGLGIANYGTRPDFSDAAVVVRGSDSITSVTDAEYIAACDPDTITRLLAALAESNEALRMLARNHAASMLGGSGMGPGPHSYFDYLDRVSSLAGAAEEDARAEARRRLEGGQ